MAVTGVNPNNNMQREVAEGTRGIKEAQDTATKTISNNAEMATKALGGGGGAGAPSPAAAQTGTPRPQ